MRSLVYTPERNLETKNKRHYSLHPLEGYMFILRQCHFNQLGHTSEQNSTLLTGIFMQAIEIPQIVCHTPLPILSSPNTVPGGGGGNKREAVSG
jgi:hypothetical protein